MIRDRGTFTKVADKLAIVLAGMACLAMGAIVVLLVAEMIARALFDHSFTFAWEYSAYCMGILIFGGLGWTLRTGGHIHVTGLQNLLAAGAFRVIETGAHLAAAVLASLLALAIGLLCKSSFFDQTRSFLATETLLFIPQFFMMLGAFGFALQAWLRLYLFITGQPVDIKSARIDSPQSHL